ncbi:hypothetical protein BDV95DRAFT_593502 [Massariosphaeria phaeospora]|uniref:Uncharacterized protein n=1 Tax=Massariosphaeria phaeospora TaxID=100035 RepID=A0A7C8MCC7_9PLEO|nr:hypothetical protein BDV95DRAFT_593502 [Massariosphaeria phaeospora]
MCARCSCINQFSDFRCPALEDVYHFVPYFVHSSLVLDQIGNDAESPRLFELCHGSCLRECQLKSYQTMFATIFHLFDAILTFSVNSSSPLPLPSFEYYEPPTTSSSKSNPTDVMAVYTPGNSTSRPTTNVSSPAPTECTGCVLAAYSPTTIWFAEEQSSLWTSVVVTATKLTETITYMDGTAIDTITTEIRTVNQTQTVIGTANQTITLTKPHFTYMLDGTALVLDAGPTYILYTDIYGALDSPATTTTEMGILPVSTEVFTTKEPVPTCDAQVQILTYEEVTEDEDWYHFIQTISEGDLPNVASSTPLRLPTPLQLPSGLVDYLKKDPKVQSFFRGSDIATCTLRPTSVVPVPVGTQAPGVPHLTPPPFESQPPAASPPMSEATSTYLSTTYESTETHVTRQGCLRPGCGTAAIPANPGPTGGKPEMAPNQNDPPHTEKPEDRPNPPRPEKPDVKPNQIPDNNKPDLPNWIDSVIHNPNPQQPTQSIKIGDKTLPIHIAQPTNPSQPEPNQPDHLNPNPKIPGVVIGTETLKPGQTTHLNGVEIVVPETGSAVVVGGNTVAVNSVPTLPSVLTYGENKVTANAQGQYVVGTQTLTPGGVVTVDGSTLSLGPSGTIAVVNGVTQTLEPNSPGVPNLTLNGQTFSASVVDGTTAIIYEGQTLSPGAAITVSGTTYSMPASASGSVVLAVVDGITSTLGQSVTAAAALTIDGKTYSASVRDGTTEYSLGPNTTLKPGEAITISGTTYSLDPKGTALVVNGKTSTVPSRPASNSASTTRSGSKSESTGDSTSTDQRDPGNFIASGFGIESTGPDVPGRGSGLDVWAEGWLIGLAGWVLMLV